MSRATFAVAMCSAIAPPRRAHASSRKWSAAIQCSSSSASIGNANGVKNGSHWRSLPKQRNAALELIPRGSKPTRS